MYRQQDLLTLVTSLPFRDAPLSHWVHLPPNPPGPHSPLVSIRILPDRVVGIDASGVYHFFSWHWRPVGFDEDLYDDVGVGAGVIPDVDGAYDRGCFVAARDILPFRSLPRLPFRNATIVLLSTHLFLNGLLSLCTVGNKFSIQLLDVASGIIRSECIITLGSKITSVAMDIVVGTACQLCVVGCEDGSVCVFKFDGSVSESYLSNNDLEILFPGGPVIRTYGSIHIENGNNPRITSTAISPQLGIFLSTSQKKLCVHSLVADDDSNMKAGSVLKSWLCHGNYQFTDNNSCLIPKKGWVVTAVMLHGCNTTSDDNDDGNQAVAPFALHVYTLSGELLLEIPLDISLGIPQSIKCTYNISSSMEDVVLVCGVGGVRVYDIDVVFAANDNIDNSGKPSTRVACIDSWDMESIDSATVVHDVDIGPYVLSNSNSNGNASVLVAAGCSSSSLLLHAMPGISRWTEERRRRLVTDVVSNAVGRPVMAVVDAGRRVADAAGAVGGKVWDIGKEVKRGGKGRVVGRIKNVVGSFGGFLSPKRSD